MSRRSPSALFARALTRRVATLLLIGAAAVTTGAAAAEKMPLTLAVARSPLSLAIFVADDQRLFAAEGLELKLVEAPSGRSALQMMAAGRADVGTAADTAIMFEAFERSDFGVLATFAATSNDVQLLVRRSAGVRSSRDLAGKRIGVVAGTSAQYFLDSYLLAQDIDPRSLQQIALRPEEGVERLRRGDIDALSVFEPYAFQALTQLKGEVAVLSNSGGYTQSFHLVAQKKLLPERQADLERLLRAVARAEALIREDPRRAQAIMRRRLQVEQAFVDWIWPRRMSVLALNEGLPKGLLGQARWALRAGHVAGRTMPDFEALMQPGPLRAVAPDAVGLPGPSTPPAVRTP